MKWYQINPPYGKWHLEDNKCYNRNYGYFVILDDEFRKKLVEPTQTPKWSAIPLPDPALSRICNRCFKRAIINMPDSSTG